MAATTATVAPTARRSLEIIKLKALKEVIL
jgi:hypothetical protein